MVVWSDVEIAVFFVVILMIGVKLWTVWHVSLKSKASKEGKMIFLGLIAGFSIFGILAKVYITKMMGM